jgi:GntR family transcriptional regulator / MocR family aminotransferase
VLADFMAEVPFGRHVRRMPSLYAERREALLESAERELAGFLDVVPAEAGMHLVGLLPEGEDDREVSRRAAAAGVEAPPLSAFSLAPPRAGSCWATRRSAYTRSRKGSASCARR